MHDSGWCQDFGSRSGARERARSRAPDLIFSSNFRSDFIQVDQNSTAVRAFYTIFFLGTKMSLKNVLRLFLSTPIDFEVSIGCLLFEAYFRFRQQNTGARERARGSCKFLKTFCQLK